MNYTPLLRPVFERRARRVLRAADSPVESQIRQLRWILYQAADTLFGRWHRFDTILALEDPREAFATLLPPDGYEAYRPFVQRMLQGESDILWPGICRYFACSSGTSGGRSKIIPVTDHSLHLNHYAAATDSVALYLHDHPQSRLFAGKAFILGGAFIKSEDQADDKVRIGDLSATLIDRIPPLGGIFRIPDKQTALLSDWSEKLPLLAEKARHHNVTNLSGVPSWFLQVLLRTLQISGKDNLRDIWPDLEVFFHGGISFTPYRDTYISLTGGQPINFHENYNASEGFFAAQAPRTLLPPHLLHEDSPAPMLLLQDATVYYEFFPLDCTGDPTPVMIEHLQPGKVYELVITAPNGLYRYRIGDTIRVVTLHPLTVTIAGRTKSYINAFGEEVMEENADRAIAEAAAATGAAPLDYTAAPQYPDARHLPCHIWLIEWHRPPEDMQAFAKALDNALRRLNSDYDAKRTGDIFLREPLVLSASPGDFDRWLATYGSKRLGGQRKVPRLSNDDTILRQILGKT